MPTFSVRQDVYDGLAHESFLTSSTRSWRRVQRQRVQHLAAPRIQQVWVKSAPTREKRPAAAAAARQRAWQPSSATRWPAMPPEYTTPQLGVPGPWNERLPHFRAEFTPSAGEEIQSEYLLPRDRAVAALRRWTTSPRTSPPCFRSARSAPRGRRAWLSPSHGRATVCLHFTWIEDEAVAPVIAAIEERLAAFDARPHWGKRFTVPPAEIARLYPRLDDFRALMGSLDRAGKFRNEMIQRLIVGEPAMPLRRSP